MFERLKNLIATILQVFNAQLQVEPFSPQDDDSFEQKDIGLELEREPLQMKEKEDQITKLLQETSALLKEEPIAPHDYASVKQRMLELELQRELEYLTELLNKPEQFAKAFKKRCQERASDDTRSLGFHQEPFSATNCLYWQIAALCCAPATMQEMLSILLPNLRYRVAITLSDDVTIQEMRENRPQPEIKLEKGLASLTQKPEHSELAHYVIAGDCLLDVRDIIDFPLGTHSLLRKSLLDASTPSANPLVGLDKLVQPLFVHNQFFRVLQEDLDYYENKGITPKRAVEELIQGLLIGGQRMTGSTMASLGTWDAFSRFMHYLNSLPESAQTQLKTSRGGSYRLSDVLEEELGKGKCVETAAGNLREILEAQKTKPTEKEELKLLSLPEQLLNQAIAGIAPNNDSELVFLFLNFPTQWYGLLLTHLMPQKPLDVLTQCIGQGFFNPEQRQALVNAILEQLQKNHAADDVQAIFAWGLNFNDKDILQQVISLFLPKWHGLLSAHMMPQKQLDVLTRYIRKGFFRPEHRQALVKAIWEQLQFRHSEDDGIALFEWALILDDDDILQRVISMFSPEWFMKVLLPTDQRHPLVRLTIYRMPAILAILPEKRRFEVLRLHRGAFGTALHYAATDPELLKAILTVLPKETRLEAVIDNERFSGGTVLDIALSSKDNPDSLQVILESLPENERLEAVMCQSTYHFNTVLQRAVHAPKCLKTILKLLPPADRLEALKPKNEFHLPLLYYALSAGAKSAQIILKSLPESERLEALKVGLSDDVSILQWVFISEPQSSEQLLATLPESARWDAVSLQNKEGKTLLECVKDNPELYQRILDLLPKKSSYQGLFFSNPSSLENKQEALMEASDKGKDEITNNGLGQ